MERRYCKKCGFILQKIYGYKCTQGCEPSPPGSPRIRLLTSKDLGLVSTFLPDWEFPTKTLLLMGRLIYFGPRLSTVADLKAGPKKYWCSRSARKKIPASIDIPELDEEITQLGIIHSYKSEAIPRDYFFVPLPESAK